MAPPRRARPTRGTPCYIKVLLVAAAGLGFLGYRQWPGASQSAYVPDDRGMVGKVHTTQQAVSHGRAATTPVEDAMAPVAGSAAQAAKLNDGLATTAAQRQHEVFTLVTEPPPLQPLLEAEAELQLPKQCRGRAHTELEGGVVKWGTNNVVADAAACCDACSALEAKGCNVWVFCGDRAKCGERYGQCWLKHTDDPTDPPSRGSSLSVPWTSGTLLQAGVSPDSFKVAGRQKRALRQQRALTVCSAAPCPRTPSPEPPPSCSEVLPTGTCRTHPKPNSARSARSSVVELDACAACAACASCGRCSRART